ncbi:MAG: potassium transporter TrkG, partial [Bacillota bacterium]
MVLNYKAIIKLSGFIIDLLALLMLPSLIVSYIYGETDIVKSFVSTILPIFVFGSILALTVKADLNNLKIREGFLIVALCWILGSIFGCLPFIISGCIPNFFDAFFETVSGFTTTGSTILPDIEILPKGLLFWRSFTHWIGGMGIIVFAIALLPALGISGQKIARAETTGPTFGKITSKVSESAKILYLIYISFTMIEIILLRIGGMN